MFEENSGDGNKKELFQHFGPNFKTIGLITGNIYR